MTQTRAFYKMQIEFYLVAAREFLNVKIFFNQSLIYFYTFVHYLEQIWSNIVSPFKVVQFKKDIFQRDNVLAGQWSRACPVGRIQMAE